MRNDAHIHCLEAFLGKRSRAEHRKMNFQSILEPGKNFENQVCGVATFVELKDVVNLNKISELDSRT